MPFRGTTSRARCTTKVGPAERLAAELGWFGRIAYVHVNDTLAVLVKVGNDLGNGGRGRQRFFVEVQFERRKKRGGCACHFHGIDFWIKGERYG